VGVHIDGYIAVVAHTIVIGATAEKKVKGRKADVILAAYQASQAALRLLSPGNGVSLTNRISLFSSFNNFFINFPILELQSNRSCAKNKRFI
jgi:hypothetical protein